MTGRPMGRREKFRRRQKQSFVGRRGELAVFETNLRRDPESEEFCFVFHVRGQSGVGKSMLVRRWKAYAEEARAATVLLDDEILGPLEAMKAVSDELARQGLPMKMFTKRLGELRQRQKEADLSPPRSEGSAGAELIARTAALAAGAAFGAPIGGEQVARGAGRVREQFRERRDSELVRDPVGELTPVFIEDLTDVLRDRLWAVLFFDVYERAGPVLDRWLRDLVRGERYGELPLKVIVVMSGQRRLAPAVWEEVSGHVEEVVLGAFTEEETRDLLTHRGVTDEDVITTVLSLSDRLPVLVDMLAHPGPATPGEIIDPAETAVERFLKWESDPVRRQAILDCALPQEVDGDIYRALIDPDAAAGAETWLGALPFITSHGGRYRYHDIVRNQILRLQRTRSVADWRHHHSLLADHHARQCTTLEASLPGSDEPWENERWRDHRAAEMYHRLCAAPHETRLAALEDCIHACDANIETLNRWIRLIHHAGHDTGNTELMGWADSLGVTDFGDATPVTALLKIIAEPRLSTTGRSRAHGVLGGCRYEAGHYGLAIMDFSRAIELQPDEELNHYWRGMAHHKAGGYDLAVADFSRAIELEPDDTWNHHGRGLVYHGAGSYDLAIADFSRAIELQPDDTWGYRWRGLAHQGAGSYDLAIADFTRAIELQPDEELNYYGRGLAHHGAGSYDLAVADFSRAIELQPDGELHHYRRGLAHHEAGSYDLAIADLTRAIELQPDGELHHYWRGMAHYRAGGYELAIADFSRAIELQPDDGLNHYWRGMAHHRAGSYALAVTNFSRAIELQPDEAWQYHWRGRAHHAAGYLQAAITDFARAGELQPDEDAHHRWGDVARHEAEGRGDQE